MVSALNFGGGVHVLRDFESRPRLDIFPIAVDWKKDGAGGGGRRGNWVGHTVHFLRDVVEFT